MVLGHFAFCPVVGHYFAHGFIFIGEFMGIQGHFGLTRAEGKLLTILLEQNRPTLLDIMDYIYGSSNDLRPSVKIVPVMVCHLRKKMDRFGIEIENVHGIGYRIEPEVKAKIRQQICAEDESAGSVVAI